MPFPFSSSIIYRPSTDWVQDTAAATTKWSGLGDWDVSGVADFSWAFSADRDATGGSYVPNGNPKAETFVGSDLIKWKTTALTSLDNTFKEAKAMNSDLGGWNVAKVTDMEATFQHTYMFAGTGLGSWDTSSVTTLFYTFDNARAMNADLSRWTVGKVTTLKSTFRSASKFTGTGLSAWKVGEVTTLKDTFRSAPKFTGAGLPTWNIAKVTAMADTFTSATSLASCAKRQIVDAWKSNAAFVTWDTAWATDTCPPLNDAMFKQASWGT